MRILFLGRTQNSFPGILKRSHYLLMHKPKNVVSSRFSAAFALCFLCMSPVANGDLMYNADPSAQYGFTLFIAHFFDDVRAAAGFMHLDVDNKRAEAAFSEIVTQEKQEFSRAYTIPEGDITTGVLHRPQGNLTFASQTQHELKIESFGVIEGFRTYAKYQLANDAFACPTDPSLSISGTPDYDSLPFPRADDVGTWYFDCNNGTVNVPDTYTFGSTIDFNVEINNLVRPLGLTEGVLGRMDYLVDGGGIQRVVFYSSLPEPSAAFLSVFPTIALLLSRRRPRNRGTPRVHSGR